MNGMARDDLVGNEAAAAHIGVAASTWRSYVARKQAPQPYRREVSGGHALPVWRRRDLDRWERPGRGARTDLTQKAEDTDPSV